MIEQIKPTELQGEHDAGLGAVLGGVAGAGLGSLIGAGTGEDVAIAVGAIGGAFAGNYAQKKYEKPVPGEQVIVRLGSGVLIVVTQPLGTPLRVGQRVYVEGTGQSARVLPR
ncbi:MAG: glycine zipper 2TM domain-containing protein [Comamonadaceae bacterium]|nr:glycine zipper 2TM domain-containing protein [Comamonadaceae bacterium]